MASQNQALALSAVYQQANSWALTGYPARQSTQLTANSAGSGNATGKFYAFTNLVVYGATFCQTALATSTYTVNGTGTTSCQAL